jgi:ribosomal protein S12 methylthiotransferase accessory factor
LAEATVHAAAEYIERHAQRLAEFEIDNPGGVGIRQFWFVDHGSLPDTPRCIVEKYRSAGMCVRILDITSEVAVPTFYVRVFDDPFTTYPSATSDGFGCHPNPEVAVTMALLEAAQTRAGIIAGGREDYSLQARSLGRHERPRTMLPQSQAFWFGNDRPFRSFQELTGFVSCDILEELEWIVGRVEEAGVSQFIVVDYTIDRIRPAFAVRVIIPGLETTNPLFTGERARATSIRDMLPRFAAEAE